MKVNGKMTKKHGKGKFFYLDRGQMYTGVWCDNIPKCGTMEDFGRHEAPNPTTYPIPECKLQDTRGVIKDAEDTFLDEQQSQQINIILLSCPYFFFMQCTYEQKPKAYGLYNR